MASLDPLFLHRLRECPGALRFPGTEVAYKAALDCVGVDMLTEAQVYLSTHPGERQSTSNQGFNISNGDVTRWKWVRVKQLCLRAFQACQARLIWHISISASFRIGCIAVMVYIASLR